MMTESVVAFAVRKGNPKHIYGWADLARPGIQILTPNPATSGGAQWNILALYGAALRGQVAGVPAGDTQAAYNFLKAVLKNVKVMDKDAQTSISTFEKGIGDVAITYESTVLYAQQVGESDQLVIPTSTILIQNPVAVVDAYAKQHGAQKVAQAFVNFLTTPAAQQAFVSIGYRPVNPTVAKQDASKFATVKDLWTIDYLGGWNTVSSSMFGNGGLYSRAIAAAQG
jgi:sulfate/thiosulfate transport system substrate-binding protein